MLQLNSAEVNALSVAIQHRELPRKFILDTIHPGIGEDAKIILDLILGFQNKDATDDHYNVVKDYEKWYEQI